MEFWLEVFSIVAALALVVQVVILGALFFELKKTTEKFNKFMTDMEMRVGPLLTRTQLFLDELSRKLRSWLGCFACGVSGAGQAQRFDRVLGEASDRLRDQLIHADRILTGTLEAVEEAGFKMRQNFLGR